MKKLKTDVKITYKKNGNIKTLSSPYDNDTIINQPIHSTAEYNHAILRDVFKGHGEAHLINLNNQ